MDPTATALARLAEFVGSRSRLFVLTGAGISTDSGIPDYRDENGDWKRKPPVNFRDFAASESVRRRYWARAAAGWPRFAAAAPNAGHLALARLEAEGRIGLLVTQNVDGLHQRAEARRVLDLHGRLDRVACLSCGRRRSRDEVQAWLSAANPGFAAAAAAAPTAPDGDADLPGVDHRTFRLADCPDCGGILKPDVVFFGEAVPRDRVEAAYAAAAGADGVLVAGSSLAIWSGYRFVRAAADRGVPVAIVNLGRTRADEFAALKVPLPLGWALPAAVRAAGRGGRSAVDAV